MVFDLFLEVFHAESVALSLFGGSFRGSTALLGFQVALKGSCQRPGGL